MSGNALQLFLDRFLLVNKKRYASNPEAMQILNALQLQQLTFDDWQTTQVAGGAIRHSVDISASNLEAVDQEYYSLDFTSPLVSVPASGTPIAEADLPNQAKSGLYFYKDANNNDALTAAIVVRVKDDLKTEAISVIRAACLFDIDDSELLEIEGTDNIKVDTKTFTGILKVLASDVHAYYYDGAVKYDGSITY